MIVDLHVHTAVSSPCSFIDPEQMIDRAVAVGLDALCVTEHEEIRGAEVARDIGRRKGFTVFRGIEIYTEFGDVLVYGLYRDAPAWKTPFEELVRISGEEDAVMVLAHPCRIVGELEKVHGEADVARMVSRVDAIETFNGGCTPEGNRAAAQMADSYGLPQTGGSDAHHLFQVGRCVTVFDDHLETEEQLIEALRSGRYHGTYHPGWKSGGLSP